MKQEAFNNFMLKSLTDQYKGLFNSLSDYWVSYGGTRALLLSPYLHFSIIISILIYPNWSKTSEGFWYDVAISVLPNILGFTLGGYAILLSFGERILSAICGKDEDGYQSPFIELNAAIIHFIICQVFTIVISII